MSGSLSQEDLDKIQQIAVSASSSISTTVIQQIAKETTRETILEVLKVYGIHDPQEMQRILLYGKECMKNKQNISKGFFTGIGGQMATIVVSFVAAYLFYTQGVK